MKKSMFNVFSEKNHLMFNTLTKAMVRLEPKLYRALRDNGMPISDLDSQQLLLLKKMGFLLDDEVDEIKILKHNYWMGKFRLKTLHLSIMTTLDCNFRCVYCFEHRKSINIEKESIERIKKFVENEMNKGYKCLHVDWYGGEPLLNFNAIKELSKFFISYTRKHGMEYNASITTNGYLFTPKMQSELQNMEVKAAQITVDGDEKHHDMRRFFLDETGTFSKIIKNVTETQNDILVTLRINVDENNVDFLTPLIEYIKNGKRKNISIYACIVTPPMNSEYDVGNRDIIMEKIIEFYYHAIHEKITVARPFALLKDFCGTCIVDSNSQYIITPNTELYKCGESFEEDDFGKIGVIKENGEKELTFDRLILWEKDPFQIDECKTCSVLPICYGGCGMKRVTKRENVCSWEYKHKMGDMIDILYEQSMDK